MKLQTWTRSLAELTFPPSATHFVSKNTTFRAGHLPKFHQMPCCACHKKMHSDITMYMLPLPRKVTLQHHPMLRPPQEKVTPFQKYHAMLPRPRKVRLQHHQMLRLPRAVTVNDPRMIRTWSRHLAPAPSPSWAYFSRFGDAFWIWKYNINFALRLSRKFSPNFAPATKSETPQSPKASPATKSGTPTSQNGAQATKSEMWGMSWDVMWVVSHEWREWCGDVWCVMCDVSDVSDVVRCDVRCDWCARCVMWWDLMWVMCGVRCEWCVGPDVSEWCRVWDMICVVGFDVRCKWCAWNVNDVVRCGGVKTP